MIKYRITVTWDNDLSQTFHITRSNPLKFEDFNLKELLRDKETDNVIGLHITVVLK